MDNAFDLNSLFDAEGKVQALDAVPIKNTAAVYQGASNAFSALTSTAADLSIATGQHNAVVAQKLAEVETRRAGAAAVDAVDLAAKLERSTQQLEVLRGVANDAQLKQGALLQERQKLTENFPGWLQNPLGRITAAYKVSQLDEQLAGMQKNAELATISSNELASRSAATIREEAQAHQLRSSANYAEDLAVTKEALAGKAEMLNGYGAAVDTSVKGVQQQVSLATMAANDSRSGQELALRKSEQDRANREADQQKALVDTVSRDWLRLKGNNNPNEADMNRARMVIGALPAESRVAFGKLITIPGADVTNPVFVKRQLVTSGASIATMRDIGMLLDDKGLAGIGESVYSTQRASAMNQLITEAYNNSTSVKKDKNGKDLVGRYDANGMAVTQEAWWSSLKPADRKAIDDKADAYAKQQLQASDITSLNMLAYSGLKPNHHFSLTANTVADVARTFQFAPNSPETAVMLNPSVRQQFEIAAARTPENAGPEQFKVLYEAFKAAGSKNPEAAVANVVSAYSRGYSHTTQDGKALQGLGIDLPAYYIVQDANGQVRNLARAEDVKKFYLLQGKAKAQSQERGILDKVSNGLDSTVYSIMETSPWSDAGKAKQLNDANAIGGASVRPDKKLQSSPLKQAAEALTASTTIPAAAVDARAQSNSNLGTDKLPTVWMDTSGEQSATALRDRNTPEAIAARAATLDSQRSAQAAPQAPDLRSILESRARDNAQSIADMQKADDYTPLNATSVDTLVNDVSKRVFESNQAAAATREDAIWQKAGMQGTPAVTAQVMDKLQAVQSAPTAAAKEQGFLQLVQDLYKRAFSSVPSEGKGYPEAVSAQAQAAAAAEYDKSLQKKK